MPQVPLRPVCPPIKEALGYWRPLLAKLGSRLHRELAVAIERTEILSAATPVAEEKPRNCAAGRVRPQGRIRAPAVPERHRQSQTFMCSAQGGARPSGAMSFNIDKNAIDVRGLNGRKPCRNRNSGTPCRQSCTSLNSSFAPPPGLAVGRQGA